ncbi:hypothetical protein D5272_07535 [bacterium D16-76]|nr:hypothetical protein [bacterium D16-76]
MAAPTAAARGGTEILYRLRAGAFWALALLGFWRGLGDASQSLPGAKKPCQPARGFFWRFL